MSKYTIDEAKKHELNLSFALKFTDQQLSQMAKDADDLLANCPFSHDDLIEYTKAFMNHDHQKLQTPKFQKITSWHFQAMARIPNVVQSWMCKPKEEVAEVAEMVKTAVDLFKEI